ncbi:MAG TPA: histidine phosphatase family protein, partial [Mesorhizobium sp.]|nr:histidine phosphatase family protein [Mesorhizobium sp.]
EGIAEPVEALDPLSGDEAAKEKQKEEIRKLVREFDGSGNLVLVTHQENIREVAGISPREGEAVVVRPEGDQLIVIGRIIFN